MKNSTDFAMGRRPKLKSEEFFISTFQGVEIIAILCLKLLKKCYTVWEHNPKQGEASEIWSHPGTGPTQRTSLS